MNNLDCVSQRCQDLEADVKTLGEGLRQAVLRAVEAESECEALRAEVARLTACLRRANLLTEHFERHWYLNQAACVYGLGRAPSGDQQDVDANDVEAAIMAAQNSMSWVDEDEVNHD